MKANDAVVKHKDKRKFATVANKYKPVIHIDNLG